MKNTNRKKKAEITYAYESLMIGDAPVVDVEGAMLVGMKAIHFNPERNTNTIPNNPQIQKLEDLKQLF